MNLRYLPTCVLAVALSASIALADDARPALSLSKAAKLAEDAIAAAALPSDCFLRSINLIEAPDGTVYYRASYQPPAARRVLADKGDAATASVDVIRIAMDGKVTFEKEESRPRRSIQVIRN